MLSTRDKHNDQIQHADQAANFTMLPLSTVARTLCTTQFSILQQQAEDEHIRDDPRVVHRMRVSTRRLRSVFSLFNIAFRPKAVADLRKALKHLARLSGKVRDRDVLLINLRRYYDSLDGAEQRALLPFIEFWKQDQIRRGNDLVTYIQSDDFAAFKHRFKEFLSHPAQSDAAETTNTSGLPMHIGTLAPVMIVQRYSEITAFETHLPTATLELLHRLRIQCKYLRYTLEFFENILGKEAAILIERLITMQDLLGNIQDVVTAGKLISTFVRRLERHQPDTAFTDRINPAPMLQYLAVRQSEKQEFLRHVLPCWEHISNHKFRRGLYDSLLHIATSDGSA